MSFLSRGRLWRSRPVSVGRHSPDGVGQIIGNYQRTARIYRHTHWTPAGFTILSQKAGDKIHRRSVGTTITERNKAHFVANGIAAVPATVLTDEHTLCKLSAHGRLGKINAQ